MADGKHIEVAKAYVTIVPSLEGSQKTISNEMGVATETAAKEAGEKGGKTLGTSLGKGLKLAAAAITASVAAVSAAAIGSAKAFVNAAKQTAEYGDTVDKQSQKVGLSAKTWQEYDYVMKIAGTDMQSMTTGMKTLTNQIDAAKNGNKDAVARFKALGISLSDLKNLSREDLFKKTISGLQDMKDGTDRAALANKLFGKSGQDLQPLLNMTASETQGLIDKANDLGMVMSDDGVKASATFQDSLTSLKGTMQGVKNNIMAQFLPGLSSIADGLADVLGGKGADKLSQGITQLLGELKSKAPDVLSTITQVGTTVIQGLGPMLPSLVSTIFTLLTQAITTVSSMMPQLMPAIISGIQGALAAVMTALPIIVQGLTQLVMSLVTWLSSEQNVANLVSGIIALVTQLVDSFAMILPILLPAIVTIISEVAKALTEPKNVELLIKSVLTLIGALLVAIGKCVPKLLDLVKGVISNLGNLLADFFTWAVPKVADGIGIIINKVKSLGSTLFNNVKTWFSNVLGKVGAFVADVVTKIKQLPSQALQMGKDLIQGLINGIVQTGKKAVDTVKALGGKIVGGLKSVLGIHSPSRVFMELGELSAEGYLLGISDMMSDAELEMKNGVNNLTGNMSTTVTANGYPSDLMGNTTNYNGGNVTINVYGAEGQNVNDLANVIAAKLQDMTSRKGAVYA